MIYRSSYFAHRNSCEPALSTISPKQVDRHLLYFGAKLGPAGLGVEVVTPAWLLVRSSLLHSVGYAPLHGPVHDIVAGNERRDDVEGLGAEAPPGVEDGVVGGTGERVLAVRADAKDNDTALLLDIGTWRKAFVLELLPVMGSIRARGTRCPRACSLGRSWREVGRSSASQAPSRVEGWACHSPMFPQPPMYLCKTR